MKQITQFLIFVTGLDACCEHIAIRDTSRSRLNGIYSSTGIFNKRPYYIHQDGYGLLYYSTTSRSWHVNSSKGSNMALIKGVCCNAKCPGEVTQWQERLMNGRMVNLPKDSVTCIGKGRKVNSTLILLRTIAISLFCDLVIFIIQFKPRLPKMVVARKSLLDYIPRCFDLFDHYRLKFFTLKRFLNAENKLD